MADVYLEHTASQINKAIAALHADTTGPSDPSSEVTGLSGTETFPLRLPSGQLVFITYTNMLADIISETAIMDDIAEQARDAAGAALVAGAVAGDGISITVNDPANSISISVDTLDGGTF